MKRISFKFIVFILAIFFVSFSQAFFKKKDTVFEPKASEYKGYKFIKISEDFLVKEKSDLIYVYRKDGKDMMKETFLIKEKKKSKFFEWPVTDWVSYYPEYLNEKLFKNLRFNFLFMDVQNAERPEKNKISPEGLGCMRKKFELLHQKDFIKIQEEALVASSGRYKIHFQIKQEYYKSFIEDFEKFMITNGECKKYLCAFKFLAKPFKNSDLVDGSMATIVVYFVLIPGEKNEKNIIVKLVLDSIINRYGLVAKEIDLGVVPRYSKKIKDFIYIAGGEGHEKWEYLKRLKAGEKLKKDIFTDDMVFFKGYEIDYKVKNK